MADPRSTALIRDAMAALQAGDSSRALAMLDEAGAIDPTDAEAPLNRALALRMRGDLPGALRALDAALAIEPYSLIALLSKGALVEQLGRPRDAAKIFRNALKIAPPEAALPQHLKPVLAHARQAVAKNTETINAFLRAQTAATRAKHGDADLSRFDECLDILSGTKKAYVQEPLFLTFPKLPPLTFYPRTHFPWMAALEAQTDVIRDELVAQLKTYWEKFHPYMQLPAGAPLNQWAALNKSPDWSSLHLWRDGAKVAENCALFPKTVAILDGLPLADQPGYAPTAMFSVLQPHTAIPPHTGSSNTRLIAHLPLIIPDGCRFRVGNDTRPWVMGESFVFDDTIEHEAWNDSDQLRAVLIFDVWNPLLSMAERDLVSAMTTALNVYDAGG
ncbi:MAG: aspartyl/asparaginyl beta-hydroxylase domain-containing protein [Alphaproteobacteria bacterium]|nr:aspartyl/asparaginyl beta-hydroxylase domain-containing protein [Alphaproteobacteria bacterium]